MAPDTDHAKDVAFLVPGTNHDRSFGLLVPGTNRVRITNHDRQEQDRSPIATSILDQRDRRLGNYSV